LLDIALIPHSDSSVGYSGRISWSLAGAETAAIG
jgi:hypothetical protein